MAATTKSTTKRSPRAGQPGSANGARGGLAQQVTPDEALAAVIGPEQKTRAEVTKAIWAYVKDHDLQDDQDRRRINSDDKLRPVFGGQEQVSMFEMTRLVNQHLR